MYHRIVIMEQHDTYFHSLAILPLQAGPCLQRNRMVRKSRCPYFSKLRKSSSNPNLVSFGKAEQKVRSMEIQ